MMWADPASVVYEARKWLGTPWCHGARARGQGVDCGQLLAAVYEDAGVVDRLDVPYYPQDFALHRDDPLFLNFVESYARRVDEARPGDVALFKFGRCISHGAIVIAWPKIIHACVRTGSVIEDSLEFNMALPRRLAGIWRPRRFV